MYKNEMEFRKTLCTELRKLGWFIQSVEVGSINRGVPDLFMIKKGISHWVELKNNNKAEYKKEWHIDFREGQQAWLRKHYTHGGHSVVIEAGKDQMVIHFFSAIIVDNILTFGYEKVNGYERLDYLLSGGN